MSVNISNMEQAVTLLTKGRGAGRGFGFLGSSLPTCFGCPGRRGWSLEREAILSIEGFGVEVERLSCSISPFVVMPAAIICIDPKTGVFELIFGRSSGWLLSRGVRLAALRSAALRRSIRVIRAVLLSAA